MFLVERWFCKSPGLLPLTCLRPLPLFPRRYTLEPILRSVHGRVAPVVSLWDEIIPSMDRVRIGECEWFDYRPEGLFIYNIALLRHDAH